MVRPEHRVAFQAEELARVGDPGAVRCSVSSLSCPWVSVALCVRGVGEAALL